MKNFKLFNQSFGTVGSPNQTGETLTRENRIGLMSYLRRTLMLLFAILVMSIANIGMAWGATELANINFKSWTPQSISAGSTVNGCYFKSAVTITAANGATFSGKASTSSNWVAIPLSGINGSITITLTHASGRPQWGNYLKGLNAAPSSSDLSSNPSSVGDNTRPGSNTTTSSWTINTDKLYGVFYVGKGSNGLSDIYSITITTPDLTYYYRGADNSWGADAMTKSSEGFYSYKSSTTNNHQFKIAKSESGWDYNYSFVDPGYLGTSISTIGDYGSDNCYIWSAPASYYIIVFRPGSPMNTTANPKICASATLPAEKFTISFNNGGGSGSMSSISNVLYGSDKATTANTFTKAGYRFTGWKANVDVKVGGATKTAGTLLDDEVTIQEIKSDITLTAQWEVDDGCNKIFWFANSADATTNGVTNNTTTFSGVDAGTTSVSGSITIDGKTYTATGRGSNNSNAITFTVPANKVGTLYGLANSSGSSARTLTLTNTASYSKTQSTSASSSTAGSFTFEDMPAGSYSLAWSGNGAENMLCLKLCDAGESCSATQPGALSKGTLSGCSRTITASGSAASNNTWYWQSSASGTDKSDAYSSGKAITEAGTYYLRSFCSDGSGCWSDAVQVTITAADMTPAAPTALTAASHTAKGTTFTVTDGGSTNNYEFYVSTNSSAPGGSTSASYTATSTTKTITDKVAGTTYYAWVRAKCGSNKSAWTALTGNTFTTSTVDADYHLTNVNKTSGATTGIGGSAFTAVFAAVSGYSLPSPVVTIGGNSATSGTDYTWNAGTGTLTINADKINGDIDITMSSPVAAPTNVAISGAYWYYPGETISLTATATGGNGPKTYQWYHGGTADGDAIEGATSATYSKASCVVGDAGSYYCKVTCGGSASRWSDGETPQTPFKVKIMQFYLKNSGGGDISNHALTKVDATHATLPLSLTGGTTYKFRVTDGCGNWYGNNGEMTSSNCTNWAMDADNDCRVTTSSKSATYTFNFDFSGGLLGSEMRVSVVYPSGDQPAGKIIYWDNSVLNWASAPWYRIGRGGHNNKTQMTLVPGTAKLYKVTTAEYNGFEYWHIANNEGEGTGNIFWTKDSDPTTNEAITEAMGFEGSPVTAAAVTFTPTLSHATGTSSDNNNCEFYEYGQQNGMKTDRVTISDYSNGTITVNYTNTSNVASTLTSGNADLAHSVILTSITAVANTGYDASAITINGNAYAANHVVTEATTIAASFTPHVYTITYLDKDGAAFSGSHVDSPNAHPTSHTYATATTLNSATKTGYTFGGWYTSSDCSTGLVTSLGATAYTADITLYAKWTVNTHTLTWDFDGGSSSETAGTHYTAGGSVNYGTSIEYPSNGSMSKAGYTFDGWSSTPSTMPDNDLTITAQWASSCTPQTISKVVVTGASAGTTSGYNNKEYVGTAVVTVSTGGSNEQTANIDGVSGNETGYKMGSASNSIVFATLKKGSFQAGDIIKIGITRRNDVRQVDSKYNILTIYYGTSKSDAAVLTTITTDGDNDDSASGSEGAGIYSYTLTAADVTAIGAKKGIGVFRESSNGLNAYIHSVEIYGCRDWSVEAPTFSPASGSTVKTGATVTITGTTGSTIYYMWGTSTPPANAAAVVSGGTAGTSGAATVTTTGISSSNTYLYAVAVKDAVNSELATASYTIDDTAPTLSSSNPANGATDQTVSGTIVLTFSEAIASVDGSKFTLTGATKGAVAIDGSDATKVNIAYSGASNESTVTLATAAAAVSDAAGNSSAALSSIAFTTIASSGCETIVDVAANSSTTVSATVGSATVNSPSSQAYAGAIKLNSSGYVELTPKAGSSFAAGDKITITMYCGADASKTIGYRLANKDTGNSSSASVASRTEKTFESTLVAADITDGKIKIYRYGSESWFVSATVEKCGLLPDCTTPVIPALSNQTVCPGSDIAAWDATQTAVLADGETASYSWKKKGNDTEIEDEATLDLGAATESMAGTYVVTVTVSKAGNASSSASKEVTLTVTPATETPSITSSKATVYPGNSVTLTATCGSTGVTWNWYLCANSDGTGAGSSLGTSATYTIASAPAAGTYYYKAVATGDGTHSCGAAEYVYTLTVSAASECENYYWFVYADDAMANGVVNNRDDFFSNATSGSGNAGTYTITIDEVDYTATKRLGAGAYKPKFTVPASKTATLYVYGKANSSDAGKHLVIKRTSDNEEMEVTDSNTDAAYSLASIPAGEWTLSCGSNNWRYAVLAVKLCGASSCTDATPTIAAANTTVCSGTELSITATGYETSPTSIQWQKLNSSTSAWDNISGATEATYSVASAAAEHAGSYRCVVTKGCARTSNTVTITIQSAPVFGDVPNSVTVMQTIALSISTVEASDAASYKWYKSANNTWDESDPEIGTSKNLIKAYADEATGSPSYYVICRATNSCGTTTSSAIEVNVTAYVAEDCAEKGNEGEAEFDFENTSMSSGSYNNETAWSGNSNSKYLTYIAPTGKNFATAKVTIATSGGSSAAYAVYNGSSWTYYNITGMSSSWQEKSIDLPANTTKFQIGRRLDDKGTSSGTFYLHEACFTYTETCTATAITVSGTGSETHIIGDSFTEPEFTVKHGGTTFDPQPEITYTSSNEDIATVDDNGTVNFQGMAGSVTITAAYAGDATYCASEGHYTITVSCSDDEPKIVPGGTVNMSGCNSSVVLNAKKQDGTAFAGGTYQWYRDGEAISGATSASYTAVQAGVYTVERTNSGCTNLSSNSATVTSETVEPEIEHLAPFQYYHVDKPYSDQMKMRHLFTVKGSAAYGSTGKNFKMELSKNGAAATDVTTSNAFSVVKSADNTVDTVMIDLNKLNGKYAEDDELVLTCKAVDCEGNVSSTYKDEITIHVIDATPTMALILNGKGSVVGGDFLEDYEPKNLQEQTGSKTWSGEWPMYTDLKTEYNVTPVNGYAPFNKLNYEPFDIIFLTDFPKASKSDAAATILDDMAALCDYRPLFSFKTHMVHKSPSKWAAKGFTTSPTENKGDGRTYLNIVCYAHPMFVDIKTGDEVYTDASDGSQLVYKMLSGTGYEKSKGMQGFEIDAAENFVTIGLTHYNASVETAAGVATWTPGDGDRMLVSSAERQANPEARMILLSLNAGAHSKLTEKGRAVVMKSLEYLIQTSGGLIEPADCSYTFDNAAGDNNWNTAGNWGPRHNAVPGAFTSARIAAPAVVDIAHAVAMEVRIVEGGSITIPAGKGLEVKSTIRHMDGSEISPTEISELTLEASSSSNGTLIFNNNTGDTKATVWAYSKGFISGGFKNYQYIGTPFNELNALYNYYGSWIYSWGVKKNGNWGWVAVKNGGPMNAWTGYCISQESPTYYETSGTMTATGTVDIAVPAGENMVIGNSWTAPIDINALTTDDLDGLVANIYFFNTGVDKEGTAGAAGSRYAGGTYVTVPVEAARYEGEDDHINSMQGFFVKNTSGSDGALHLDYDRHVRGTTRGSIIGDALHAPARRAALDSNEPEVLKIKVSGENYDDKLLLLAREDFSTGFDNGWDGDKWDGNESSLYIYTTDSEGTENSVSAMPQLEGTVIGFRAGEDDAYTLNFEYLNSDEPLYLYDVENNTYTQIMTGMTYRFFTTDNEKHERFIITRTDGSQVATGIEPTSGSLDRSKAKKLLIEDKMFIIVNGMLYDATGKVVK